MDFPDIGKVHDETDNFRHTPRRDLIPQEVACVAEIKSRAYEFQTYLMSFPPSRTAVSRSPISKIA